ncbi:MAG: TonB-dependent receptor [Flammeovirgaceae bacterium]|nr:TonB-dependent receptor [Flammeovirgaceae bacterium]
MEFFMLYTKTILVDIFFLLRFLIFFGMSATLSFAQTKTVASDSTKVLEEVEVSDSYLNELAGLKVTKIDSAILQNHIQNSLSELLAANTSIFIKSYGRGALATASFRGTSSSHTRLLWNGMDITSPMLGQVDFSLIPIALAEEISIAHGAASLENTNGGIGGAVQLYNKPRWHPHRQWNFLQGFGSFQTFTNALSFSYANGRLHANTKVFFQHSDNDFTYIKRDLSGNKTRYRQENAQYQQYGFTHNLYRQIQGNQIVSLKLWGQKNQRAIPTLDGNENRKDKNQQTDKSLRAMLSWERYSHQSQLNAYTGFSIKDLNYFLAKELPYNQQYFLAINTFSREKSWNTRVSQEATLRNIGKFLVALQLQHHRIDNQEQVSQQGYRRQRWEATYLFNVHIDVSSQVKLNVLSRQDIVDWRVIRDTTFDYRNVWHLIESYILPSMGSVSLMIRPIKALPHSLKASLSKNFRFPSLNDLYFQPGGNPHLRPEKGYTAEMGISWQKQQAAFHCSTQLTAYYSWIEDWILWRPQLRGYWTPENLSFVHARGVELDAKVQWKTKTWAFTVAGNYGLAKSTIEQFNAQGMHRNLGKQLPYIPLHTADLSLKTDYRRWSFQYLFQYNSHRYVTLQNSRHYLSVLPPYYMSDIVISRSFAGKKFQLDLHAKILNLLNENYRTVLGRYMPRRHFEVWANIKI